MTTPDARTPTAKSLLGLGLALGLSWACAPVETDAPAAEAERSWPADAVVAVGSEVLLAEEVDRLADVLLEFAPAQTLPQRRRQALAGLFIPRAAVAQAYPVRRQEALARAEAYRAELVDGNRVGPPTPGEVLTGNVGELGLEVWFAAREAPVGTWSEPIEGVAKFTLFKRLPYEGSDLLQRVERHVFPMDLRRDEGEEPPDLQTVLAGQTFTVLDPAWEDIVPGRWRYLMRGERP